ncbi:hypothetical protein Slin15195_G065590 [Septoria linicola]|uniref:Uncharacterized protein n=1 Tax=Septoria linicola TaxID=215465 RepID=A0A9Q9AQI0_9PEZI|nr:hypothetical protein Slin15195_G065590 [Septoria linicola]
MADPWTPHNMNPNLTNAMFQQTGMPTMGRRYMGYGASPFGPGGPVPIHSMNYLGQGMAHHGSMNTLFGAGQYPSPRLPFPLGMMGAGDRGLGSGGRGGRGRGALGLMS